MVRSTAQMSVEGPFVGRSVAPHLLAGDIRTMVVRLARQLRRHDAPVLTMLLHSALGTVAAEGALPMGALAEAERLSPSAATRLADRLEREGFVERRRNPSDGRGINLAITPAGRSVVERHRGTSNAWLAARLARLSRADRAVLAEALVLLAALLTEEAEPDVAVAGVHRSSTRAVQVHPAGPRSR